MINENMDTNQTEPQDLSVRRAPEVDMETEKSQTVDKQLDANIGLNGTKGFQCWLRKYRYEHAKRKTHFRSIEPNIETNELNTNCQTNDGNNGNKSEKKAIPKEVVEWATHMYERNTFWDEVLEQSKSTETLDCLTKMLTAEDVKTTEEKTRKGVTNCDNELKHMCIKLKFINELYDGLIASAEAKIKNYQIVDSGVGPVQLKHK